ncbi:RDD family protein [Undibacterium sp.]|uniref:RDD family protein n=1 Tax=Undibacterium sp. TaxID=1914977 RepID=UPI0025D4BBA7|nr:RDD family protein [Undibacterium sp.]
MEEPDFSRNTEKQLRQILTRIDTVRYPERVKEIEARLSAGVFAPERVKLDPNIESVPSIASVWRRIGAFCIDMLILGIIGFTVGSFFHAQFAALGAWGRALGFVVTLMYFGVTESSLGGGQSLGMRVLGIRVVSRTGEPISTSATFIRAAIFCLAYFLNGAAFDFGAGNEWGIVGMSVLIFGLIFSLFYMLIFNRRTRQSIHDLAVGAFVVKAGPGKISLSTEPIWRGHAVILSVAILTVSAASILIFKQFLQSKPLASLVLTQQAIRALPGVDRVDVNLNSFSSSAGTTNRLLINAFVDASNPNSDALAQNIAQLALKNCAEISDQNAIVLTLTSGYDIGIALWWSTKFYMQTPDGWRALSTAGNGNK